MFVARVTTITGPKCAIVRWAGTGRVISCSGARVPSLSSRAERGPHRVHVDGDARLRGVNSGPAAVAPITCAATGGAVDARRRGCRRCEPPGALEYVTGSAIRLCGVAASAEPTAASASTPAPIWAGVDERLPAAVGDRHGPREGSVDRCARRLGAQPADLRSRHGDPGRDHVRSAPRRGRPRRPARQRRRSRRTSGAPEPQFNQFPGAFCPTASVPSR